MHWPRGITAKGELRHQFHHVIDVAPTVLEAAGLPEPKFVHGMGNLRVVTLSDALTPDLDDGEARIRVVNGRATTSMGVTVTPWNQTPGAAQVINTTTTPATNWIIVPSGQTVAIRTTTTPGGALIDVLNILPQEGQELIVVAGDPVAGTTAPLQWIVTTACSRP